jgi:hypothetical protein
VRVDDCSCNLPQVSFDFSTPGRNMALSRKSVGRQNALEMHLQVRKDVEGCGRRAVAGTASIARRSGK